MDIASSIQVVLESIVLKITRSLRKEYNIENLCLSGGVALNCVINGKILKEKIFKNIWIQPASGDAGGALGAALQLWYHELGNDRKVQKNKDEMSGSFLGPSFNSKEIKKQLKKCNAIFNEYEDKKLFKIIVNELVKNKAIGWFSGKMEFGPRALGGRSVIANPCLQKFKKSLI